MEKKNSSDKANRDPITGEPGAHPVGTAAGAAAMGAAGAAVGSAAGPIGTGVGAAAGAVVGGLTGSAASEHFNPTAPSDLVQYIDYKVVDLNDDKIGTVDAVWEDQSGQPSYLAIRTGWLGLGKAHVVPAADAQVNVERRKIKLPYQSDLVKSAPTFESADDITTDSEAQIRAFFGITPGDRASYNEQYVDEPRRAPTSNVEDSTKVRLKAEEVKIGKREVEYGGVRLRKIIRTETVNQPVELQREEIVVERVPVQGAANVGDESFSGEEIYVPLRREEAVVEKSVRATEEIRVGKRVETEQQNVKETVRREDVEIEQQPGSDPRSSKNWRDEKPGSGRSI